MVVIFPKFGRPLDEHKKLIETCSKDTEIGLAVLDYSSKGYTNLIIQKRSYFDDFSSAICHGIDYGCSNNFLYNFF
jgi:hypothetical protein